MSMSINHTTKVIAIPKADTTFVETNATTGYEIRSYDEYELMRELADYLDSEAGIALPNAFTHATEVTISGVIYARAISFLAPYTITFENDTYQVKLVGGSNNNMLDVLNPNNVSVIPANSAGLQTVVSGSGVTEQDKLDIAAAVRTEIAVELARLSKIANLHAIDATLVVTPTSRVAGSVSQTISTVGDTTTVT